MLQWLRRWLTVVVPFGILSPNKPRHFREMLQVLWDNRGRWGYAWRILRHGVCDGCSLGTTGLRDEVLPGPHLCLTRLKLLKLNTLRAIPDDLLRDSSKLESLSNSELHSLGRIPYPLLRRAGSTKLERLSWDAALDVAADALRQANPDRVGLFLTSRGLTNESYYTAQKLCRIAGSPHVDSCARLCHAASGVGLAQTIGWGAPTISLTDLIGTELIFIIGSNLPNNQPVSTKYLRAARKAGAHIVVLNPFREPALERYWIPSIPSSALFGTQLMDEYHAVRPGGDIALMSGILKGLDEIGGWDEGFVDSQTVGAPELRKELQNRSWTELATESGISKEAIQELASRYARAQSAVIIYSMGLTQYEFGVDNVKMVVNLALARGMIGRKNCGILPIRGHSGVQGAAECGADADKLPGAQPITEESCKRLERVYGHPIPHRNGLRAPALLNKAGEEGLDVLYLIGGNHLETMPDRRQAKRALGRTGLRIHQDIVLNSSTLLPCDGDVLLLPAQTRYEQKGGGTSTSTERRIRFTPEISGPRIEEAQAEWEIPALIGQRLKPDQPELFAFDSSQSVRDEMARVMPLYDGIDALQVEGDAMQWGGASLGANGFINMPDKRARFSCMPLPRVDVPLGSFLLTMRRGKQFNSITFGNSDPLTRGSKRNEVLVDPRDLKSLGLRSGQPIRLRSSSAELDAVAKVGPCRRGHVQGFWPECNVLLTSKVDPESGEPDYNTAVSIEAQ